MRSILGATKIPSSAAIDTLITLSTIRRKMTNKLGHNLRASCYSRNMLNLARNGQQ